MYILSFVDLNFLSRELRKDREVSMFYLDHADLCLVLIMWDAFWMGIRHAAPGKDANTFQVSWRLSAVSGSSFPD